MDGQIVLDRKVAEKGLYPAVNVFSTSSKLIDIESVGERHYRLVEEVLRYYSRYNELEEIKEWVNNHNVVAYFFQPNTL